MNKIPKQICGIYYLYNGEEIVYIGKSWNVYYRVGQHAMNCIDFDCWTYEQFDKESLTQAERDALLKHRPKYNKFSRDQSWRKTARQPTYRQSSSFS